MAWGRFGAFSNVHKDTLLQCCKMVIVVVAKMEESKHEVEPSTRVFGPDSAPPISPSLSSPNLSSSLDTSIPTLSLIVHFRHSRRCVVVSIDHGREIVHRLGTIPIPPLPIRMPTIQFPPNPPQLTTLGRRHSRHDRRHLPLPPRHP